MDSGSSPKTINPKDIELCQKLSNLSHNDNRNQSTKHIHKNYCCFDDCAEYSSECCSEYCLKHCLEHFYEHHSTGNKHHQGCDEHCDKGPMTHEEIEHNFPIYLCYDVMERRRNHYTKDIMSKFKFGKNERTRKRLCRKK